MILYKSENISKTINEFNQKILNGLIQYFNEFKSFFWGIGFFGWQIAFVYAFIISSRRHIAYGLLFFGLFSFSGFMNEKVFKKLIFDPRPNESAPFLTSEKFKKGSNGMPSGHAQQTAFALTYAYMIKKRYLYESMLLFSITVIQRYIYSNHTIPQLIAGTVLGIILGILSFYLMKRVERKLEEKEQEKIQREQS
jgi:membrane-associated phospholipid phosphatase